MKRVLGGFLSSAVFEINSLPPFFCYTIARLVVSNLYDDIEKSFLNEVFSCFGLHIEQTLNLRIWFLSTVAWLYNIIIQLLNDFSFDLYAQSFKNVSQRIQRLTLSQLS